MNTLNKSDSPIVVGTPLKCGTWMIRQIISGMTGLPWFEPALVKGIDPSDPANIVFKTDAFYSWHFVPVAEIQRELIENDARSIFVVRNIYAMTLSMYHHFADNIDWEIGRGANKSDFFASLSKDEGISRIICRRQSDGFNWQGIGGQLFQMQKMLEFAAAGSALILTFEQLVEDKAVCVRRCAEFLSLELTEQQIEAICLDSAFSTMQKKAESDGGGSHFRAGLTKGYFDSISAENKELIQEQLDRSAPELAGYAAKLGIPFITDWHNGYEWA